MGLSNGGNIERAEALPDQTSRIALSAAHVATATVLYVPLLSLTSAHGLEPAVVQQPGLVQSDGPIRVSRQ